MGHSLAVDKTVWVDKWDDDGHSLLLSWSPQKTNTHLVIPYTHFYPTTIYSSLSTFWICNLVTWKDLMVSVQIITWCAGSGKEDRKIIGEGSYNWRWWAPAMWVYSEHMWWPKPRRYVPKTTADAPSSPVVCFVFYIFNCWSGPFSGLQNLSRWWASLGTKSLVGPECRMAHHTARFSCTLKWNVASYVALIRLITRTKMIRDWWDVTLHVH